MLTCPDCRGEKERAGIGCGPAGCRPMVLPCPTCDGTGKISEERARWMEDGKRLREWRLGRPHIYVGLRAAAALFRVPISAWSDAEAGRVDLAPLIARVMAT